MKPLAIALLLTATAVADSPSRELSLDAGSWAATMIAARHRLTQKAVPPGLGQNDGPRADMVRLSQRLWEKYPETDWYLQDHPRRSSQSGTVDAQRDFGWYFRPDRDAKGEADMVGKVLRELSSPAHELVRRLDELVESNAGPDDVAWLELYVRVCRRRRAERLELLSRRVRQIAYVKHYTLGGSHYAYTEGLSDAQAERHFHPGSELCLLEWDGHDFQPRTLIRDDQGVIRDPDVSPDGRRILFSWKKSDREDDYHLYELTVETEQVRQLTFGLGVADYEGAYLPGGDIVFNSTRCVQTVDCWWTEVSNLYRCDQDGKYLRRLAFDQVHDNFPTVTSDGRILFTRWEYNDRGQVYPQPLLQMNADGTNQSEFYGGNSWFPTTILHARSVPKSNKVLAIATGHHSRQVGKLIEIDPSQGRQENVGVALIAPPRDTPSERIDRYGQDGELFQYPYPLNDREFLVTYHPAGWDWAHGGLGPRFGVYFMTRDGHRELLARDARLPCSQPIPFGSSGPERVQPRRVDYRKKTGTCYIQDVYRGPGLTGIERGTVKSLRVISLDFRAAGIGSNRNGGPGGGALISTPVAIGNGAWDPKTIIGDATVHEDGSVFCEVPARRPVYFQLLDQRGHMVQTMRSWTTIQPGENVSCVGCHEHKNTVPMAQRPQTKAMKAPPETLRPFYGSERALSFAAEVQPILDRHCTECHSDGQHPYNLADTDVLDSLAKRNWSRSYLELTHAKPDDAADGGAWRGASDHPMVNWVSAQSAPPMLPPYSAGANRSKLIQLLQNGHEGVELTGEDMHKLAAWIDLGVPFCGDYAEANAWNPDELRKYQHFLAKRKRFADEERRQIRDWIEAQQ